MVPESRIRRALDITASVAMVLASVALVIAAYSRSRGGGIEMPTPYTVGDQFAPSEASKATRPQLVLWLQSQCRYSTDSLPFYAKLMQMADRKVDIVAMSHESREAFEAYLKSKGIVVDHVVADVAEPRLTSTPTVLLVSTSGIITSAWTGQLSPSREAEVIAAVSGQ